MDLSPAMDIGSVAAIINMLTEGYGIAFIPEFTVRRKLISGELARLGVKGIDISLSSFFIYNKERWVNPVMRELMSTCSALL